MHLFTGPLGRSLLAAGIVASALLGQVGGVAHADSGFGYTNPGLHFVAGADSGNALLAITNYIPSMNVPGARNPTVDWGGRVLYGVGGCRPLSTRSSWSRRVGATCSWTC